MTSEELQKASATASACANQIQLPLRAKVWKGQSGEFSGAGVGSSLDFQDHRNYIPGDDPRHINWQAYARSGQYTMKLYREEVRPIVDLVIDVSASMFFDSAKLKRSAELLYFLCHSCVKSSVSLNTYLLSGNHLAPTETNQVLSHRWYEEAEGMQGLADSEAAPDLKRIPWRANAIHILISDLLFEAEPLPLLQTLVQRHGSGMIFSPYCPAEAQPDWEGNCDFIDSETKEKQAHRIDSKSLQRYLLAYKNHFALWTESATKYQVQLSRISSEGALHKALIHSAVRSGSLEVLV